MSPRAKRKGDGDVPFRILRTATLRCLFPHRPEGEPRNTNAAFIHDGERLVSLCSQVLPHPRLLRRRNKLGMKPLAQLLKILLS